LSVLRFPVGTGDATGTPTAAPSQSGTAREVALFEEERQRLLDEHHRIQHSIEERLQE
jgi:hypothetical protein